MDALDEALKEFLVESHENLGQLDLELVALEKDPTAQATIASIFRKVHTLKGSAGFLGFPRLEALAHGGESLLSKLRDGKLAVTAEIITALLSLVDAVRDILSAVEDTGQDGPNDHAPLLKSLARLREARPAPVTAPGSRSIACDAPPPQADLEHTTRLTPAHVHAASAPLEHDEPDVATPAPQVVSAISDNTIRLDIGRLDKLMNLVSELVLARNQIFQHPAARSDPRLAGASRQLNLITSELQEEVMAARMQPIGNIWGKFPRVVRDLATSCGKRVNLELQGSETELDKTVIEAMKDPLTHMIRNSIDHGIESPERRLAAGKSPEGRLCLRAFHESGQVHIEISDDGAGIDAGRVRKKAIERGLVTAEQAEQMSDQVAIGLIFVPGFSTADQVTSLSGRGVGMDVVKNNVEKIGGTVDVLSVRGAGTVLKMRIPLTLAIIRAIIVRSGGERYAVPQASMIELIRLEGGRARSAIERIHGASVYRFRGKLLPIIYLNRVLADDAGGGSHAPQPDLGPDAVLNIVVLQVDERRFGLIVDRIHDTQEVVVKPLGKLLRGMTCLAGGTIMGDGRVALILDVAGLGERSGVLARTASPGFRETEAAPPSAPKVPLEQLVLLRGPDGERMAVPLATVVRLEDFPASAIERSGTQFVVQYRGMILPLLDVAATLDRRIPAPRPHGARVPVVVCTDGARRVGLMVDRILDILADPLSIKGRATRQHVLFTAVVQQQVTEVLDVPSLIQASEVGFLATPAPVCEGGGSPVHPGETSS